ncbi:hypothetical protein [Sphingosinicella sp. BN140058]|uniref:hypothetical protein n=1 Tax=Sphingosinicella sp. BN140058 TaxID=1892855 RepID=UPI0010107496|nr:hypothetical protein [Sphingosinicella sp. BN140058]QAY76494.1 hypothetical protein ETR14_08310 [Sphingosinicella sp. BN140058]
MGIMALLGTGMALQFEERGNGFVYRANRTGPARPVSAEERARFVKRGGIDFLIHCVAFGLCMVAAAMVTATFFPEGGEAGGFVLMGAQMVAIGYALYRSLRWSMLAPERALADRAPVAPSRPRPARRKPSPTRTSQPRNGGCLLLLGFAIAELVGGVAAGLLTFGFLDLTIGLIVPGDPRVRGISALTGLAVGFVTTILIDRRCERKTGSSLLDLFSYFH